MMKYTYDAFISYRHTEPDKFAAENLHKQLEAFRLPANIAKKQSGRTKIERVFRDRDELPLTSNLEDPILKALQESEYLIVICSPRLRESLWCKREIETFIKMHGREKVLAVLIEGEPEESFPEELLFAEETVEKPDGTVEIIKKEMEPLAADIRGKNKRAMLKAMRLEILRLLAPMFSVSYDDLRQRHRERRMKRILAASLSGAAICLAFGAVSTVMALRIQNQNKQIEAQNEEIMAQSAEIQAQSAEIQQQNRSLLEYQAVSLAEESQRELKEGDRIGAIHTAVQALTEYEGMQMPYTPEARFALTESLHVYDSGSYIKPRYQLKTAGIIDFMKLSADRKTLLTCDRSGTLTVWDIASGMALYEKRTADNGSFLEYDCTFLGNDKIAYVNGRDGVDIYSISEERVTDTVTYAYVGGVYSDREGKYLLVSGLNDIALFDGTSLELLGQYTPPQGHSLTEDFWFSREGTMLAFEERVSDEEGNFNLVGERELHFFDLSGDALLTPGYTPVWLGENSVQQIQYRDDVAYVLLNYSGEEYSRLQATILACRPKTGEVLWQRTYDNCFGYYLLRPYADDADKLLFTNSYEAKLISEEDGEEYASFPLGTSVAGGAVFADRDMYILFTRSGEYHIVNVEEAEIFYLADKFQSHSQNVKDFQIAENGYLVLPYQDNRVTVYEYSIGADCMEYTENVSIPENEYLEYSEAVACAQEKGLAKAELAHCVFYDENKSLMFIQYTDDTMEIYDTLDMSLQCSLSGLADEMRQFLGRDAEGNMYMRGLSYGYMLSPDFKPIAVIEGLLFVDTEENRMFLESTLGVQYTVPLYTLEELLAKAEEYVLR